MLHQLTKALFESTTINALIKCKENNGKISPVDLFDLNFRIYKNRKGLYNFELLVFDNDGAYFKPIGFYKITEESLYTEESISVTILGEFEESYKQNNFHNEKISKVAFLTPIVNGLIASCFPDTLNYTKISFTNGDDQYFTSNGVELELIVAFDGNRQLFLDDVYGVRGALIVYKNNGQISVNPVINHTDTFNELQELELLPLKRI